MINIGLKITSKAIDEIGEYYGSGFTGQQWAQYMHNILFDLNEYLLANNILFTFDYDEYTNGLYDYVGNIYSFSPDFEIDEEYIFSPEVDLVDIVTIINSLVDRFKVEAEIFEMEDDTYEYSTGMVS